MSRGFSSHSLELKRLLSAFLLQSTGELVSNRRFNGAEIVLSPRLRKSYAWWRNLQYEVEAWNCAARNCRPGDVVVDVGANIGIITLQMSRTVGSRGLVYAIEPSPVTYSTLVENLELNSCHNVIPLQIVAGNKMAMTDFFIAPWRFHMMSGMVANAPSAHKVKLLQAPLDSILEESNQLDYIKIDVEGAELLVLQGCKELLRTLHPLLQIEVHGMFLPSFSASVEELFRFLEVLGYRAFNIVDAQPTNLEHFMTSTKLHVISPFSGADGAYQGHGQLLFVHSSRPYALPTSRSQFLTVQEK
jgi:FkbM family methyltransferase